MLPSLAPQSTWLGVWARRVAAVLGPLIIIAAIGLSAVSVYKNNLQPLNSRAATKVHLTISKGESNDSIAQDLQQKKIIKSATAFEWYLKLEQSHAILEAGRYAISPSQSVQHIVTSLKSGKTDLLLVTILPGDTLTAIKTTLQKYGYSSSAIDTAFAANYTSPLFANRPAGQGLEGYIYPETFEVQSGSTVESLLTRDFATFYSRLQADGLLTKFQARGLNLYQAITLASIVQQETSVPSDQKGVAQVFYKRLATGMVLGSDTTFIYAAHQLGVTPSPDLDSPYNTRINPGLPPGPIGNMNLSALEAVADPASTDYLYFVAGDDGRTYFANTLAEHETNIQKYCHTLCQ